MVIKQNNQTNRSVTLSKDMYIKLKNISVSEDKPLNHLIKEKFEESKDIIDLQNTSFNTEYHPFFVKREKIIRISQTRDFYNEIDEVAEIFCTKPSLILANIIYLILEEHFSIPYNMIREWASYEGETLIAKEDNDIVGYCEGTYGDCSNFKDWCNVPPCKYLHATLDEIRKEVKGNPYRLDVLRVSVDSVRVRYSKWGPNDLVFDIENNTINRRSLSVQ